MTLVVRMLTLVAILGLLSIVPVRCTDISDSSGNIAYDNGTISWGPIPGDSTQYKTDSTYTSGSLRLLFDFARSFLATVQPKSFPFALLTDLLNGDFDLSTRYKELIDYAIGFAICIAIGLLYIILMPLCACCFCCCRCCGKCGGNLKQKYDENDGCKRMGLGQCLFLFSVCMFVAAGCAYVTNDKFTQSLDYVESSVHNNFDDIEIYLNNTVEQFLYLAQDLYQIVSAGITRDIDNLSTLLGVPIRDSLLAYVDPAVNSIIAMDSTITDVLDGVNALNASAMAMVSDAQALVDSLDAIAADIVTAKTTCSSDCIPSTACDSIDESVLAVGVDFSSFPDLSSTIANMESVASENLTGLALQGRQTVYDLPDTLETETASTRTTTKSQLNDFATLIYEMVDGLISQIDGKFDTTSFKTTASDYVSMAKTYDQYRFYGCVGLMVFLSLVPFCYLVGICCGTIGHNKRSLPTQRGCLSNCGGCCLLVGVFIIFFTCSLLMLLALLTFAIGGNLEKICEPILDLTLFKDFIDEDGIPGFNIASMLLGNATVPLHLYDVLLGCRANKAPFRLMYLSEIIPLEDYMDYQKYIGDIDSQFDSMASSLDLSSMNILTPETQSTLDNFKSSGASTIDYGSFYSTLADDILAFDIDAMITSVQTAASLCNGSTQTTWLSIQGDLETIRDVTVPNMESSMTAMNVSLAAFKLVTDEIEPAVDRVIDAANVTEMQIQDDAAAMIINSTSEFATQVLGYVEQYKIKALDMVYNDLGACRPVWNLYSSFSVILCNYLVDTLNGFWFTLGWSLIFFTPSIIVAVKLSKHYRRMNECEGYNDEEDDSYIDGYSNH